MGCNAHLILRELDVVHSNLLHEFLCLKGSRKVSFIKFHQISIMDRTQNTYMQQS